MPELKTTNDVCAAMQDHLKSSDRVKLAICFERDNDPIDSIMSGFTVGQLMNLDFFVFINKADFVDKYIPELISCSYVCMDNDIDCMIDIVAHMNIILTDKLVFAELSKSIGKYAWFVYDKKSCIDNAYINNLSNDICLLETDGYDYKSAIKKLSLYLNFVFSDRFIEFSTSCKKNFNIYVEYIDEIFIDNINAINSLLDIKVNCLNNIQIETTSVCNLKCEYCPNSTVGREPALMQTETYYRIIDSIKEYMPDYSGTLAPHFYGEPLMDKRLEQLIGYTRQMLPDAIIEVYTNGELLTVERYMALKSAGVNMFKISQHTELPSSTLQNCLTFIKLNHPELFSVDYKVYYNEKYKMNRGGLVKAEHLPLDLMKNAAGCSMAHRVMTFDYKGQAVLCCNDYLSRHVFGNIQSNSIQEIWEGKAYKRIRNQLMFGYLPFDMCKVCFGFSLL
jgi:8-amino-3,8-dideoxy-alpha-D-manno-octulosonate transaminase